MADLLDQLDEAAERCEAEGELRLAKLLCEARAEVAAVRGAERQLGSRFVHVGEVTIGCMAPDSRDAMDLALERWRKHVADMQQRTGYVSDDPVYGFAYWLFRWSGIIADVNLNAPENPFQTPDPPSLTPPSAEERT